MRKYETIYIADPDLHEGSRKTLFDKFTGLIAQQGGLLVQFEDWGNRKLAYEIKKKSRGHYICMTYGGSGELIKELERNFRLDENVMKFMTILLEKEISEEDLKAEIEAGSTKSSTPASDEETDASDEETNESDDSTSEESEEDEDDTETDATEEVEEEK